MTTHEIEALLKELKRIAEALERIAVYFDHHAPHYR